jgi:hypothetical protein
LGALFVEDPDEPQNRMTKYNIVQGEYRDTFTIETDPTLNKGIIKPMKVCKPALKTSLMWWGLSASTGPSQRLLLSKRPLKENAQAEHGTGGLSLRQGLV